MSHIGKALQEIRGSESQGDFAKSLGVSNVTILNYEKGHRLPDIDFLVKVAKTQHVNLAELIEERIKDSPVSDDDMRIASPVLLEQAIKDLNHADVVRSKLGQMTKVAPATAEINRLRLALTLAKDAARATAQPMSTEQEADLVLTFYQRLTPE